MATGPYHRPPQKGPIVIPNCVAVELVWAMNGVQLHNVAHGIVSASGPLNPGVAESIFSAVKAASATTTWFGHLHTSISFTGVQVKDLRAAYNPWLLSSSASLAGTVATNPIPQSSALVVTLHTQYSGRGWFGRLYLPGLTSAALASARQFDTVTITPSAIAFVTALQTAMTTQGFQLAIGQRTLLASSNPSAPPPYNSQRAAHAEPVTNISVVNPDIDSQRKRIGR